MTDDAPQVAAPARKKAGRPPATRKRGHPTLLTPEAHRRVIEQTRAGVPIPIAAATVPVSSRALQRWLQRGYEEEMRLAEDDKAKPAAKEAPYLQLWIDMQQARAVATARNVVHVQRAAAGGVVIEETTETRLDGQGRPITTTTIRKSAPDWRAAAWWLERQGGSEFWKPKESLEVTGPDGGPVRHEHSVDLAGMAARIHRELEQLAAAEQAALPAGPGAYSGASGTNTVVGEVVEGLSDAPGA